MTPEEHAITPEELDELLALDALGFLDDDERGPLDAAHGEPDLVDRREALGAALAALAALDELGALPPPAPLRTQVLGAVRARRPMTVEPAPAAVLYARQVEALAGFLEPLTPSDWARRAEPYEWTVHGLLAHLLVIEHYTAAQLGLVDAGPAEAHHLAMGAEEIAEELAGPVNGTVQRWLARARANAAAVGSSDADRLPDDLHLHGWPFSRDGGLTARAFELWTHHEDMARATGRPTTPPIDADLRTMSSFSARALPITLALTAPDRPLTATRVVLTGPGGGTFDLVESEPDFSTLIVADVVDYCRLVARRIPPEGLDATIEGDNDLALDLLASASVFAV